MEARLSALEKRVDHVGATLDRLDDRLRAVETSISSVDGKLTVLVDSVVGKLPSWWQMPAVILTTIGLLGLLWGAAQRLHLAVN